MGKNTGKNKKEGLEEITQRYVNLKRVEETIKKNPWDPSARINLGYLYHNDRGYFAETGPDKVLLDLYEGSDDGKVDGLNKTKEKLTKTVESDLDKILNGFDNEKLWALIPRLKGPKKESDEYRKIEEYKYLAQLFEASEKDNVDAMRGLLGSLYSDNISAIYTTGGRNETVKKLYAITRANVPKYINSKRKEIKEEVLRDYVKDSLKGIKEEEKAEVYPDIAILSQIGKENKK